MPREWQELTALTRDEHLVVERVRLVKSGIRIEGEFELPPLARLSAEDQVFVMAFVKADGSIKEMERIFGISYPTVKSRLARIAGQFEFAEIIPSPADSREEILAELERGEISVDEAVKRLSR